MKFRQLESIAHNIADSLGSGIGMLVGMYEMDIFGEANRSPEGFIEADFLTGTSSGGTPSAYLAQAMTLYKKGLAELCEKHGTTPTAFRQLTARYSGHRHVQKFLINSEEYDRNLSGRVANDGCAAPSPAAAGQRMTAGNVPIGEFSDGLAGRAGHIIYREPPRELQIYWEMAIHKEQDGSRSYGVTVTCDFQYWSNPRGEPISKLHQLEIVTALREWLRIHGKGSNIDLPHDLSEQSQ